MAAKKYKNREGRMSPRKASLSKAPAQRAKHEAATKQPDINEMFPATASFVRTTGWIEIGDQEGFGFIVRALDYGGLVFETTKPKTLGEALLALEKGIAADLERNPR